MDLPGTIAHPTQQIFLALALRQLAFSGGCFRFRDIAVEHSDETLPRAQLTKALAAIPRFFVGIPSLF